MAAGLAERNVIDVAPGGDAHTVERFADDFMARNGGPDRVRLVTCDMGLGFAKGIRDHLPNAAKVIDRFHVARYANAILEGLNGIIQHVKTRVRGFRNMNHSSIMIHLACGRLDLNTATT